MQEHDTQLVLENSWKIPQINPMKEALFRHCISSEDAQLKIYQCYISLYDGKYQDIKAIYEKGIELLLSKWSLLENKIVSYAHLSLLHQMTQLIELQESSLVIKELNSNISVNSNPNNRQQSIIEIRSIFSTWRERLPTVAENISNWSDILLWRQHVFNYTNTAFQSLIEVSSQLAFIGHHEIAWSINTFAKVSKKHQLLEVCLESLSKINNLPNIEIQDAFVKLYQQLKCYLKQPKFYQLGLETIKTTNLDYFSLIQKANLNRIKGKFLQKLNESEAANIEFSNAVSICPGLSQCWISWGDYYIENYNNIPPQEKKPLYVEYALSCYLQGIRCNGEKSLKYIPHILWLLSFESSEKLIKTFNKHCNEGTFPSWVWLFWIPQIFSSLSLQSDQTVLKNLLLKIALSFPQALYYPLRSFRLSANKFPKQPSAPNTQSTNDLSNNQSSNSLQANKLFASSELNQMDLSINPEVFSNENKNDSQTLNTPLSKDIFQTTQKTCDEVLHYLKDKMPIVLEIDTMISMIKNSLKTSHEEVLLSNLKQLMKNVCKDSIENNNFSSVPSFVPLQLNRIYDIYFKKTNQSQIPYISKKNAFVEKIEPIYKQLLLEKENTFQLSSLFENLEKMILTLQYHLSLFPNSLKLESLNPSLLSFQNKEIEFPGLYTFLQTQPSPENHNKIYKFLSKIPLNKSYNQVQNVLRICGVNGVEQKLILTQTLDKFLGSELRMNQIQSYFNNILLQSRCSKKFNLFFDIPNSCLFPSGRLLFQPHTNTSFEQTFEDHCYSNAIYPEKFFYNFLKNYFSEEREVNKSKSVLGESLYKQIQKEYSKKSILSNFVKNQSASSLPQFFAFKKQFISQISLFSILSYLFEIPLTNQTPSNFYFSPINGDLRMLHYHPSFSLLSESLPTVPKNPSDILNQIENNNLSNSNPPPPQTLISIEQNSQIKMRLTPNIMKLVGPVEKEAILISCMFSVLSSLSSAKPKIEYFIKLYMRDELIDWIDRSRNNLTQIPQDDLSLIKSNSTHNSSILFSKLINEDQSQNLNPENAPFIDQQVRKLIEISSSEKSFTQINSTTSIHFSPWF